MSITCITKDRSHFTAVRLDVRAALVKGATLRHLEEARRFALQQDALSSYLGVRNGDRGEERAGVLMQGAVEDLIRGT